MWQLASDATALIERYCDLWSKMNNDERLGQIADVSGQRTLVEHIEMALSTMSGFKTVRTSAVDHHSWRGAF